MINWSLIIFIGCLFYRAIIILRKSKCANCYGCKCCKTHEKKLE